MAPTGGKVSPTASNAPVSVRAHLFLDRQDASTTEPPPAREPLTPRAARRRAAPHQGRTPRREATAHPWYDPGMTQKIAVSLPDEQVISIRRAVEQGRAPSVSGFISAAVARVQREDNLAQLLDDLDRELGPVDDADLAWADKALGLA